MGSCDDDRISRGARRWTALGALMVVLGAHDAMAAGAPAQAGREFDRGTAAAARGDYLDAAAAFMRAYKLAPHAAPLYNAGLAWEAAGDRPRAADCYATALQMGGLGDGQSRDARKRLEALQGGLGRIDIEAPAGTKVSVAHAERVDTPAHIYVEKGDHALRAWMPDGRTQLKQVTVGVGAVEVRLDMAVSSEAPLASSPVTAAAVPPPSESSSLRTLGWAALGGGVVAGGVTGYLGVQALGARSEYYDSGRTNRDAYDRASSYRTWTNVALATSVVLAGVGIVILLKSPTSSSEGRPASRESASLWIQGGPSAVGLGGRF